MTIADLRTGDRWGVTVREDRVFNRRTEPVRLVFSESVGLVEALDEQQIRELFHDLKRVGDAARPETSQTLSIFDFSSPVIVIDPPRHTVFVRRDTMPPVGPVPATQHSARFETIAVRARSDFG